MESAGMVQESVRGDAPSARYFVAVEFAIEGELRFLSHHHTMVMLERSIVRAGLPIRYSQGFNPLVRLSLPLPRPVGIASQAELAWMELCEATATADVAARLAAVVPEGCRIQRVTVPGGVRTPLARSVTYETPVADQAVRRTRARLGRLLSLPELVIRRDSGPSKPLRDIDIRPYVGELALEGRLLRMRLRITENGSAKPAEVLGELGLAAEEYVSITRRTHVEWNVDLAGGA